MSKSGVFNRLLNEIRRLAEAWQAGSNALLNADGLSAEERDAVRLLHRMLEGRKSGDAITARTPKRLTSQKSARRFARFG